MYRLNWLEIVVCCLDDNASSIHLEPRHQSGCHTPCSVAVESDSTGRPVTAQPPTQVVRSPCVSMSRQAEPPRSLSQCSNEYSDIDGFPITSSDQGESNISVPKIFLIGAPISILVNYSTVLGTVTSYWNVILNVSFEIYSWLTWRLISLWLFKNTIKFYNL